MADMRDFFGPGKSPALGLNAAAASSHQLATVEAVNTLRAGGNAIDAAIAAMAVMCVVEPQSVGIGGDCFAVIKRAGDDEPIVYNGSGRAPAGLDIAAVGLSPSETIAEASVHSVTVPGAVDAFARMIADHGTFSLAQALAPAIRYAERGFVVGPRVAEEWAFVVPKLLGDPGARDLLVPGGNAPSPGQVVRSPRLAHTLRTIAESGADAFYRGMLTKSMVDCLRSRGGTHTMADFGAHAGEYVRPIRTNYRGFDVWQAPPNGQGATVCLLLNLLEARSTMPCPADAEYHLLLAEATKLAFRERNRRIADPRRAHVDLDIFVDKAQAERLGRGAGQWADGPATARAAGDTAYVAVVDAERNVVSLIASLFEGFGSGIADPETGVVFHNRGSGFSLDPAHPNALAPGKRPLHTIIPGMVSCDGRVVMALGVTGGPYQPVGQTQLISAMLDQGLDPQAAIDLPRSFLNNGRLEVEPALMPLAPELGAAGFDVVKAARPIGGAHAIQIDWKEGSLMAGSDGRKDGCALAL
jgi:gamma-glutamyltranspeptidase/glutathione hydrolase